MSGSKFFAQVEKLFAGESKETLVNTALIESSNLIHSLKNEFGEVTNTLIFGFLVTGAQLGCAGDGHLSDEEKLLVDAVFGRFIKGGMKEVYKLVAKPIGESEYDTVKMAAKLGNDVGIHLLKYIMCFAYIDGKFEDAVADRLDSIFGITLLAEFIKKNGAK